MRKVFNLYLNFFKVLKWGCYLLLLLLLWRVPRMQNSLVTAKASTGHVDMWPVVKTKTKTANKQAHNTLKINIETSSLDQLNKKRYEGKAKKLT